MTRKLKTLAAGLTALALTITLVPAQAVKVVYPDVDSGAWYYTAVGFCQQHGLMEGEGGFDPEAPLTRAALTEALYRLEGSPVPEAGQEGEQETAFFSDVLADHPNQNAIRWAAAQGVVTGYPDGTFQPQGSITRTLPKSMDLEDIETRITRFADEVEAPVEAGQVMGTMTLYYGDEVYGTLDLVAVTSVERSELLYKKEQFFSFFQQSGVKITLAVVCLLAAGVVLKLLVFQKKRRPRAGTGARGRGNYRGTRR